MDKGTDVLKAVALTVWLFVCVFPPDDSSNSWFPKENMFSFQTASTTMQA